MEPISLVNRSDIRGVRLPADPGGMTQQLADAHHAIVSCDRCPRLRAYCGRIAVEKKRAYRDEVYWGRPVPGFGDPRARLLLVGLAPAAHGANRTGRVFTGDGTGGSGDFLMDALNWRSETILLGFRHVEARVGRDGLHYETAVFADNSYGWLYAIDRAGQNSLEAN